MSSPYLSIFVQGPTEDVVATSASSVQSTVLSTTFNTNGGAVRVLLSADGNLRFQAGSNPTVTATTGSRLSAGSGSTWIIPAGQKIAVIGETASVRLNITQLL